MAKAFSVFVEIGGRVGSSLGGAIATAEARLSRLGKKTQQVGRSMSTGFTLPTAMFGKIGFDYAYQFEKTSNAVQAVGSYTDAEMTKLKGYAKALNSLFPQTNGQIMQAAEELSRAGFNFAQTYGSLKGALNLSLAGDLDPKTTADIATNVLTALNLPRGTVEETAASVDMVADHLAYAANRSNTDIRLMGETFKYVAPMARAAGINISQLSAASMIMANNGIKGSEAGVAMRSAIVRMVRPTKGMLQTLERLNININDFVKGGKAITPQAVIGSLSVDGIDASGAAGKIGKLLNDKKLRKTPGLLIKKLTSAISSSLGPDSIIDKSKIAESVQAAITSAGSEVDLVGFLAALRKNGASLGDIARIFDARQGARLITLLFGDLAKMTDEVEARSSGAADEMRKKRMQGIVGDVAELSAAFENFFITLGETGVLRDIGEGIKFVTRMLETLSKQNPALLRFGTLAIFSAAALGPLIWAMGMAFRGLSLLSKGFLAVCWAVSLFGKAATAARGAIALQAALGAMSGKKLGFFRKIGVGLKGIVRAIPGMSILGKIMRPLIGLVGLLARAFIAAGAAMMATPIGWILAAVAAIAAAAYLCWKNWDKVAPYFRGMWNGVKTIFGGAIDVLVGILTGDFGRAWDGLKGIFSGYYEYFTNGWKIIGSIFKFGIQEIDSLLGTDIWGTVSSWIDIGSDAAGKFIDAAKEKFNELKTWFSELPGRIKEWIGSLDLTGWIKWPSLPSWMGGGSSAPSKGGSTPIPAPTPGYSTEGAFANGGYMRAGGPYLVGEKGPELITPSRSGFVHTASATRKMLGSSLERFKALGTINDSGQRRLSMPSAGEVAHATSGGNVSVSRGDTSFSINIHAPSNDPREIASRVRAEVMRLLGQMESEQRGALHD